MLALSSILVPLDGSTFAEQALTLAFQLARSSGATLKLVMVHPPATTWDPGVEFSLLDPETERQLRERELSYLETLGQRLRAGGGLHVECALLSGPIAESLAGYVERTGIGLVVMTSHGRGGLGRLVLGNVADTLVRRLQVPVLVIRPEQTTRTTPRQRILVPLDGSPLAKSILDRANAFARLTGSELLLTMIVQPTPVLLPPFLWAPETLTGPPEHRELAARRYIEGIKRQLKADGLEVQSRVHAAPKVAREIILVAREEECSLVAMATHGASGLDRLMLGSVADQVVRHAEIPVLLLRPHQANEAEGESFPRSAEELIAR